MRFPGQRYDRASGLYYSYFRNCKPGTERYTQSDSIGLAEGLATYSFADRSPFVSVGPDGLQSAFAFGGASSIKKDYRKYALEEKLCSREPMDRCTWLALNTGRYPPEAVKRTEKHGAGDIATGKVGAR